MDQFIGIEAGGTKFVCSFGSGPKDIQDRTVIPTETPEKTLPSIIAYIRAAQLKTNIKAIGMVCFGPLDLDPQSATYGYITFTPKTSWKNFNMLGSIKSSIDLPVGFDTDVNGSAIAEHNWGAAQGLEDFIYLTVGTGIGAGIMSNGKLIHGAMHPEAGHILIPHNKELDPFSGVCPYHHDCLEGLASGPAMKARWQVNSALDLPPEHHAWDLEAKYLGLALANFTMTLAPKRIIIGGGVMRQNHLLPRIRQQMLNLINGYVQNPSLSDLDSYLVKPKLEEDSGICGGIALAKQAYSQSDSQR